MSMMRIQHQQAIQKIVIESAAAVSKNAADISEFVANKIDSGLPPESRPGSIIGSGRRFIHHRTSVTMSTPRQFVGVLEIVLATVLAFAVASCPGNKSPPPGPPTGTGGNSATGTGGTGSGATGGGATGGATAAGGAAGGATAAGGSGPSEPATITPLPANSIAFVRGKHWPETKAWTAQIWALDLDTKAETLITDFDNKYPLSILTGPIALSPDRRWVAFSGFYRPASFIFEAFVSLIWKVSVDGKQFVRLTAAEDPRGTCDANTACRGPAVMNCLAGKCMPFGWNLPAGRIQPGRPTGNRCCSKSPKSTVSRQTAPTTADCPDRDQHQPGGLDSRPGGLFGAAGTQA